jgi:hypothetical protein
MVRLCRNGSCLGLIRYTGFPTDANQVINYPWKVGEVKDDNGTPVSVPPGSGYYISVGLMSGMVDSEHFAIGPDISSLIKIRKIYYKSQPLSGGGCPQCFNLDLAAIRGELVKWNEDAEARLFLRGKPVANLGRLAGGQGLAGRQQVRFEADALAAMNHGEEFELRLFIGRERLPCQQAVRLESVKPLNLRSETIQKR